MVKCLNGELDNLLYIPRIKANVTILGQLNDQGC